VISNQWAVIGSEAVLADMLNSMPLMTKVPISLTPAPLVEGATTPGLRLYARPTTTLVRPLSPVPAGEGKGEGG
jgi:hypothetical protein